MCMGKFLGVRKPITMSGIQNFKILTPFVTSWTPKTTQNGPKITKTPDMSIKWLCCLRMRVGEFFWMENRLWCQNFDILTFWKGMLTFDVKYDVRYHELVQNVLQMMLECQQMIKLSWKFVWIHIFARGTRWWCQNYNILTYWRLRLIATSNMTSDIIRQPKSPFKWG